MRQYLQFVTIFSILRAIGGTPFCGTGGEIAANQVHVYNTALNRMLVTTYGILQISAGELSNSPRITNSTRFPNLCGVFVSYINIYPHLNIELYQESMKRFWFWI